jgi:tetratricopeptide (TPR) repeat protein
MAILSVLFQRLPRAMTAYRISPPSHLKSLRRVIFAVCVAGCVPGAIAAENAKDATEATGAKEAQGVAASAPQAVQNPAPAAAAASARSVAGADDRLPRLVFTPQMLYQTLLAEIAGSRGNVMLSNQLYAELVRTTRDPRVARRATEIAVFSRQNALAIEAARSWVELDPDALQARHILAGLLLNAKQLDEARIQLARLLAETPARLEQAASDARDPAEPGGSDGAGQMLGLAERLELVYRLLTRYPDKAAALQLIDQITLPFEQAAETHFVRARLAAEARNEDRATAAIDRALALRPDWVQALLFKVHLQQRVSSTLAEQTLKDFLKDHPKAGEVRLAYARSLIGDKHYDAARREFNILLEDNRDNAEVLYAVALLSLQLNDLPAAETHLKRLLELGSANAGMLNYYLGQIAEESKRSSEALDRYARVTSGEQYLPALTRAASLLAREGRLDEGRTLLQRAAEATPEMRIQLLVAESQLLLNAGRLADAHALLDGQLAHQPDQPELLYETALLAEKLNRFDVMERHLRKLIHIKPDDAHAYNALGYTLADRNLRLDEAAVLIDKGLALAPENPFILDSKGWLLFRRGAHGEALEVLRKAYTLRPDAEIAAHLGEVLWMSGQQGEARKLWSEALKSHPESKQITEAMSRLGAQAGAVQPAGAMSDSRTEK